MGVDGIKTEAHLSKDGYILLRFLPFLIIEEKKVAINELKLNTIKKVKLENGEPIPTLREIFEDFGDKIRYNFDIRDVDTGKKIIDVAEKYGLLEKTEITKPVSYQYPFETLLKPLRGKNKDIILINSLYSEKQIMQDNYLLLEQMKALDIQVVNLSHHRFNLDIFKRVKKAGFKFYVWGVLFKYFLKKYYNLRCEGGFIDGIYSFFPEKLIEIKTKH